MINIKTEIHTKDWLIPTAEILSIDAKKESYSDVFIQEDSLAKDFSSDPMVFQFIFENNENWVMLGLSEDVIKTIISVYTENKIRLKNKSC